MREKRLEKFIKDTYFSYEEYEEFPECLNGMVITVKSLRNAVAREDMVRDGEYKNRCYRLEKILFLIYERIKKLEILSESNNYTYETKLVKKSKKEKK